MSWLTIAQDPGGTDLSQYGPWGVVITVLLGLIGKLYTDNNRLHKEKDDQTTSYLVVFTTVGNVLPELITMVREMRSERGDPQSIAARLDKIDGKLAITEALVKEGQSKIQAEIRSLARRRSQ